MLKVFVVAGVLSFATVVSASAAPIAPTLPTDALSSDLVQVQHHHGHGHSHRHRPHVRPHRPPHVTHYRAGHRYNSAPSHYRRYHSRPSDWNRRGCIMVGPLWMCP